MRKFLLAGLLAAMLFAGGGRAQAEIIFYANLTGSQETPPNGSAAFGVATLTLNDAQTALSYSIQIFGLDLGGQTPSTTDNVTGAHIHRNPPGVAGGIVFGFIGGLNNDNNPDDRVINPAAGTVSGIWNANEGNGTTLTAQLPNLLAGNLYLNFHTPAFPGGEIRGQILQTPEPSSLVLAGMGLAGLCGYKLRRRRLKAC